MKRLPLIILGILVTAGLFAGSGYNVTVRDDNDILTYIDSVSKQVPAPSAVNTKLKDFLIQKLMDGELDAVQMFKYLQTFRITTPDSNFVFVAEVNEGPHGLQFYLFYFNAKQNLCSDYINIDGYFMKNDEEGFKEWNGKLVDKPYISFNDFNNNGIYEIVFNRRAHNGTWNAVETIVMSINGDGQIARWFSFYSKEIKTAETEILIKRSIKKIEGSNLILKITVYDFNTGDFLRNQDDEVRPNMNNRW